MSVAKVIEISSMSPTSFEDAIQRGISKAGESVKNIKAAWVDGQEVTVEDNKVTNYKVSLKVTFVVG